MRTQVNLRGVNVNPNPLLIVHSPFIYHFPLKLQQQTGKLDYGLGFEDRLVRKFNQPINET